MALVVWIGVANLVFLALAYLRWRLLPVPLRGIPYNLEAANRLLGDIGPVKAEARRTMETTESMFSVARKLGKPIAQLLTPFPRRIVLVDDPYEVEDILTRRHHEFDRSIMTSQFFAPLLPRATISQPSTPELKAQKRLWAGVMNTAFLDRVVAPNIHLAARELVELWRIKAAQSGGESFEASQDFANTALDAIWVAILGARLGVMRREISRLKGESNNEDDGPRQHSRELSSAAVVQEAVEYLNRIVYLGFTSPWPPLSIFLFRLTPKYRRFTRIAFDEVRELMREACKRYQRVDTRGSDAGGEELDTCAMDLVLRREVLTAKKHGRPAPDATQDPAMLEELLFLLLAGHDSTASALSWFVKLMALHPMVQTTLRGALQTAFRHDDGTPTTTSNPTDLHPPTNPPSPPSTDASISSHTNPLPTASQILSAPLPYLDATIHEALRTCVPAGAITRRATRDTTVLGCPVAAGTHLMLNTRVDQAPGREGATRVDDGSRRTGRDQEGAAGGAALRLGGGGSGAEDGLPQREGGGKRAPAGNGNSCWWALDRFEPRRWLVSDQEGREVFDGNALPTLVFGGGLRGCFGKKLAMKELRIIITLLVLSFEFLPLPAEEASMVAEERLFRKPRMCRVRLRPL